MKAFATLPEAAQLALRRDMANLVRQHDRNQDGGPLVIPASYLDVLATRG